MSDKNARSLRSESSAVSLTMELANLEHALRGASLLAMAPCPCSTFTLPSPRASRSISVPCIPHLAWSSSTSRTHCTSVTRPVPFQPYLADCGVDALAAWPEYPPPPRRTSR